MQNQKELRAEYVVALAVKVNIFEEIVSQLEGNLFCNESEEKESQLMCCLQENITLTPTLMIDCSRQSELYSSAFHMQLSNDPTFQVMYLQERTYFLHLQILPGFSAGCGSHLK